MASGATLAIYRPDGADDDEDNMETPRHESVTPARASELEATAQRWLALASFEADRKAQDSEMGHATNSHDARIRTYVRTAESMRIEIETGKAVCVCCLLPFGDRRSSGLRI